MLAVFFLFSCCADVYRMKRNNLNKGLVDFSLCWKSYNVKSRPDVRRSVPAPRHSHSSIVHENTMWVVGGSSLTGAFNDLWGFDLSNREWFHPKSTGNYPNPKACCSLVQYENQVSRIWSIRHFFVCIRGSDLRNCPS